MTTDRSINSKTARKRQKALLIEEVQVEDKERNCWDTFLVVTQALIRETKKKQRAFQIGIFTVFLVVTVITMLKSVVDCSPILFVKIGQDAVGAIDF